MYNIHVSSKDYKPPKLNSTKYERILSRGMKVGLSLFLCGIVIPFLGFVMPASLSFLMLVIGIILALIGLILFGITYALSWGTTNYL